MNGRDPEEVRRETVEIANCEDLKIENNEQYRYVNEGSMPPSWKVLPPYLEHWRRSTLVNIRLEILKFILPN